MYMPSSTKNQYNNCAFPPRKRCVLVYWRNDYIYFYMTKTMSRAVVKKFPNVLTVQKVNKEVASI